MNVYGRLALAATIAWAAGCVPITDYRKLEQRFASQEDYVKRHKGKVRELEQREQALTLRAREQAKQIELFQTRLKKSETLRDRLHEQLAAAEREATTVAASTPKETQPEVMGLEVNPATRGLVLENGVFFEPGRATLKEKGKQILARVMTELNKPEFAGQVIRIDGHTDDTPIKRSGHGSNWDLSAKRALAVLHFFEQSGIASDRLCFAGYGPYRPLDEGKTKQARSRNRRVEIVLVAR